MKDVAVVCFVLCVGIAWVSAATTYGIAGPEPALQTWDLKTGKFQTIGPRLPTELEAEQLSAIDFANNIFYLITYNSTDRHVYLIGLSLSTGKLERSVRLPFKDSGFIGVGQTCNVVQETGEVLAVGQDRILGKHQILLVDPKTGTNKLIAQIGDINVLGGASAYDDKNKILWLQYGVKGSGIFNFAFEIPSGKLVHQVDDKLNLETMDYDSKTGKIIGVGLEVISKEDYTRVLVTLDSVTGKMEIVSKIPGYFLIRSGLAALDTAARELTSFLQPGKDIHNATAPFNCLTVNADTGDILYAPEVVQADLPWSFAAGN